MGAERTPIIPHADFGDRECCACLFGIVRGDQAEIRCNECAALIRTVPVSDLQQNVVRYRQKYLRPDIVALFATYYDFRNGGVFLTPC